MILKLTVAFSYVTLSTDGAAVGVGAQNQATSYAIASIIRSIVRLSTDDCIDQVFRGIRDCVSDS